MPLAYSYTRFSTADQIKGDSLRRQTELARQWCEQNQIEFAENYRDLGVSAYRGKNSTEGALAGFLAKVEDGTIPRGSILVVESLDRLTRSRIADALALFLSIIRKGVEIVTLADSKRYSEDSVNSNFADLIISLTILSRANEESLIKSRRNGAAWDQKRQNAREGQIMTAQGKHWLRLSGDRKTWLVRAEKARIVRRVFDLAAEGLGQSKIAAKMSRDGFEPPKPRPGSVWHPGTVYSLIRDRAVLGETTLYRCEDRKKTPVGVVSGYYPEIIPPELFATVAQICRARSGGKGGRSRSIANPFRDLLRDESGEPVYCRMTKHRDGRATLFLVPRSCMNGRRGEWVSWKLEAFRDDFLALVGAATRLPKPIAQEVPGLGLVSRKEELDSQIGNLVKLLTVAYTDEGAAAMVELKSEREKIMRALREGEEDARGQTKSLSTIDWNDSERLGMNLRATIKSIMIDFSTKSFEVETLTGQLYALRRDLEAGIVEVLAGGLDSPALKDLA